MVPQQVGRLIKEIPPNGPRQRLKKIEARNPLGGVSKLKQGTANRPSESLKASKNSPEVHNFLDCFQKATKNTILSTTTWLHHKFRQNWLQELCNIRAAGFYTLPILGLVVICKYLGGSRSEAASYPHKPTQNRQPQALNNSPLRFRV